MCKNPPKSPKRLFFTKFLQSLNNLQKTNFCWWVGVCVQFLIQLCTTLTAFKQPVLVSSNFFHISLINYISSTHHGNIVLIHVRWLCLSIKGIKAHQTSKNYPILFIFLQCMLIVWIWLIFLWWNATLNKHSKKNKPYWLIHEYVPWLRNYPYLTYCFQHFELREHPSPISNGWKVGNGKCRAVRYTGGSLPECDNNCSDTSRSDSDSGTGTEYGSSADSVSEYKCCRNTWILIQ